MSTDTGSLNTDYNVIYSTNDWINPSVSTNFVFRIISPRVNNGAPSATYFECMVIDAVSFKCRWPDVNTWNYAVKLASTNYYTVDVLAWNCRRILVPWNNTILLKYNNRTLSTASLTLNIPKPILTQDLLTIDSNWFNFDFSNINIHPKSNFIFNIWWDDCLTNFNKDTMTWRLDNTDSRYWHKIVSWTTINLRIHYSVSVRDFYSDYISISIP